MLFPWIWRPRTPSVSVKNKCNALQVEILICFELFFITYLSYHSTNLAFTLIQVSINLILANVTECEQKLYKKISGRMEKCRSVCVLCCNECNVLWTVSSVSV